MMLGTITFVFLGGARYAAAQQSPPDLRMLLNLDLFSAPPPAASGGQPTAPSMLDQIRTLNSMGYLAGADPPPGAADAQPAGAAEPGAGEPPPAGNPDAPSNQPADAGGVPQL